MSVNVHSRFDFSRPPGFIRLNWISNSAGTILVNRNICSPSKVAENAILEVLAKLRPAVTALLERHSESEYAWLNERLGGPAGRLPSPCRWFSGPEVRQEQEDYPWAEIKFPAISRHALGYSYHEELSLGEEPIHIVPWGRPAPDDSGRTAVGTTGWHSDMIRPDRIVELDSHGLTLLPLWLRRPRSVIQEPWLQSNFPSTWRNLCGAFFGWYSGYDQNAVVWNPRHPILKLSSRSAWLWAKTVFAASLDPIPHRRVLLSDPARAACWLRRCISADNSHLWRGLVERDPQFLPSLLELVLGKTRAGKTKQLTFWVEEPGERRLRVIDALEWATVKKSEEIREHLPEPPSQWRLLSAAPDLRRWLKQTTGETGH